MSGVREYPKLTPEQWKRLCELAADNEETYVNAKKHFDKIRAGQGAELPDGTLAWLDTIVADLTRRCPQ